MGIREDYNQWPLGRQLNVLFLTSGFLLTAILVIITVFQLNWLRAQIQDSSTTVLENNIIDQMRTLGKVQAKFIGQEFFNYASTTSNLQLLDTVVQGFGYYNNSNPFKPGSPIQSSSATSNDSYYSQAMFYSPGTLSNDGIALEAQDSSIDNIYFYLYNNDYLGMYQGFETDQILHFYPGSPITSGYTPIVREWFYKANESPNKVIITEPYINSGTGDWIVTISYAVKNTSGNVFGVAACDVTLTALNSIISTFTILNSGFIILVSSGGMVLTVPAAWGSSNTIRIYETSSTGITSDLWTQIQNTTDGTRLDFTDANGTSYIMIKQNVIPFDDGNVTHYLLLCALKKESSTQANLISSNFSTTYNAIFWVVLTISIIVVITITILIYLISKKLKVQFKMIEKIFNKIVRRGLFPKMVRGTFFDKIDRNSNGIESLVDACKKKVEDLQTMEEKYSFYKWGFTRPDDELLFTQWTKCLYPYNFYMDKPMPWRKVLPSLSKVLD